MSYMLLIVEPVGQRRERSDAEGRRVYERMLRFSETLQTRGVLRASESLGSAAQRVQKRDGRRDVVDGEHPPPGRAAHATTPGWNRGTRSTTFVPAPTAVSMTRP